MQGLAARRLDLLRRHAELGQPVAADFQVVVLAEWVEGQPQPEALGERNLLFGGFAGVDVTVSVVFGFEVLRHLFRHQVAAVGGRIHQQVVGHAGDRTVEDAFHRLVAGLAGFEGKVVTENDEALAAGGDQVHDLRQVHQFVLVHFDQAQALAGEAVQHRLDQRALAGAARAGQQHIVGAAPGDELLGVLGDALLLVLDALQVFEADAVRLLDRLQPAAPAAGAPAEGAGRPVGGGQGRRQYGFDAIEEGVEAVDQGCHGALEVGHCGLGDRVSLRVLAVGAL